MKIYRLHYQPGYSSVHSQPRDAAQLEFQTQVRERPGDAEIIANWREIEFYLMNPLLATPDFFWWGYYICCLKETFLKIAGTLEQDVVPLPVRIENTSREFVLLFVRNVIHVTRDDEMRQWYAKHGFTQTPYLFRWNYFQRPQLFTNTTQLKGQMFCASECGDDEADFFLQYRKHAFSGIAFTPIEEI